jgi:hypothetical protein
MMKKALAIMVLLLERGGGWKKGMKGGERSRGGRAYLNFKE